MNDPAKRGAVVVLALVLLVVLATASLCIGARQISPVEVWRAFSDFSGSDDHIVVRRIRLPRTLLAITVGAALGAAGTLVQTLTRNPLAEPGILGVTAGASFAIVLVTALVDADGPAAQLAAAFLGAVAATVLVYAVGGRDPLRLVLAGVALSAVLSALSLGFRMVQPEVFDSYRFWSVGSLAGRESAPLTLATTVIVVALIGALLLTPSLNALTLGDHVAHTLGAHVTRTRGLTILVVTVLAGGATALAGPIAFVGLIVPHLARRLAAGSVPWLMALTMLLGPALMLLADTVARVLLPTGEVPVAIVTAFLGGPALIWVVRRYGAVGL